MFTQLLEQSKVKLILSGTIQNQLISSAYLFAGPSKCGKTTAVREFSRLLNGPNSNPVDFIELTYENSIKIEQIRELKKQIQYGPYSAKYLIVNIPAAEKFTTEAANSFLKTLEEPPPGVIFFLETNNKYQLLSTILSRCQIIDFQPLSTQAILTILARQFTGSPQTLERAVALSNGSLSHAMYYLESADILEQGLATFVAAPRLKYTQLIQEAEKLAEQKLWQREKTNLLYFLELAIQHFRNTKNFTLIKLMLKYLRHFKQNVNQKLCWTTLLFKLKECAHGS